MGVAVMNNYYLNLLKEKTKKLNSILSSLKSENLPDDYINYLIAGYVVTLSSILEVGIGELHSEDFDDLASLIYYTRQKVVHYGYFNGLKDIQDTAQEIIAMTEVSLESENKFYNNLFNTEQEKEVNNIVIKDSNRISDDVHFYKFKSKDGKQVVCIHPKKIFTLTKQSRDKVLEYIIDTSSHAALYTFKNDDMESYKELDEKELKQFFKDNYTVTNEDYNEHNVVMKNIITSFLNDPINSIQISENSGDEHFCKNTVDIIKDYIFDRSMYHAYIGNNYLIKDKYSLKKMQNVDYAKMLKNLKTVANKHINEKDVFFIETTIKNVKKFNKITNLDEQNCNVQPEIIASMLIQLFESGPKHFSEEFISCNNDFKKCYNNLLRYRLVFSHYILSSKEYISNCERFRKEFSKFVKILQSLDLDYIEKPMSPNYSSHIIIERNKSDFFNYKHEQFLKVNRDSYIGRKIYYSSHNPTSRSLIAILPGGSNTANTIYYKKDSTDTLYPQYTIDEKSGKKTYINIANTPLRGSKEITADLTLSNLFRAYFLLKNICSKQSKITINFHASKANCFYAHKDDLSTIILRYFNQGYLPIELLQEIKLDTSTLSKGFVSLLDKKGNVIAAIIHEKKCSFKHNYNVDSLDYFSRIDNIAHDFSKRRHSNGK